MNTVQLSLSAVMLTSALLGCAHTQEEPSPQPRIETISAPVSAELPPPTAPTEPVSTDNTEVFRTTHKFSDHPVGNQISVDPKTGNYVITEPRVDKPVALAKQAAFENAMSLAQERQKIFSGDPQGFTLTGTYSQGGMLFGQTEPGATVRLDGSDILVDPDGRVVLGFGRDSELTALLLVTLPNGEKKRHTIELEDKSFPESRIDGLDQSKVSGFTETQLVKIRADQALFKSARSKTQSKADWVGGFDWPLTGRISGVFGSRRILNGEPKRPHSGVDIARQTGTPIKAPAGGIVTLAEPDMYFGGGTVLIDHGHWIESAFLHMSQLDVEVGQRVEKGDVIGLVGATGRATGPHLHWSVRWLSLNRLVDPQLLVGEMPSTE